ncbi:MAG: hypothetical protein IIC10_02670 [Proteobacteria bacterium]|nr:hypothetical protein [Pseudomonadota bacterium]
MLVVVAIIGILSAIAIPAYQANVENSTRSVAIAGLMDLANREEQFFLNNKIYTANMINLGYPAGLVFDLAGDSAAALNNNQTLVASTSTDRVYVIKIDSATASTFSVSAVPQLVQANDSECATLSLDNMSAKTESGTGNPADCW